MGYEYVDHAVISHDGAILVELIEVEVLNVHAPWQRGSGYAGKWTCTQIRRWKALRALRAEQCAGAPCHVARWKAAQVIASSVPAARNTEEL